MRLLDTESIQRKLLVIIMLTSTAALLLACVAFVVYDLTLLRRSMIEDVTVLTRMVGRMNNITIPFDDPKVATENLSALQQNPQIVSAAVITREGKILGQYHKDTGQSINSIVVPFPQGYRFGKGFLEVFEPITLDEELVGTMFMQSNLDPLYSRVRQYVWIMLLVLLLSSAVAFMISLRLQKIISVPILQLANTTNIVSKTRDYAVRAQKQSNDEIGQLIDGFNDMLRQLQMRDEALRNANDQLEKRVAERTSALQQEVTVRKQVEEAMRASELRFRSLVQSARDAIILLDSKNQILLWNDGAANMFGYEGPEVLGKNIETIFSCEEVAGSNQSLLNKLTESSATKEISHTVELSGRRSDSSIFPIDLSFTSWETAGSSFFTVIIRDITERKRAVEQLTAFATKLEQSNRELQDFAYVASHDLQEPLRKVQAFGDRLKMKFTAALGSEGCDYLDRMQNAARRMQNLINDLLAFSRVTTKASPFRMVNLDQIVQEVLSDLEIRIQQSGAKVVINGLPTIEADPLQMRQLLQNLLSNALKFTQQGALPHVIIQGELVEETLSIGNKPVKGTYCRITVKDHGIGFDEKYLDRIFTVFQRLHNRMSYEGTGIGLAICRKIVERHNGLITARSSPGTGATFIVMLPKTHPKEP
ncbi:MAG: ATP-binding protein [Verrucomicrobiales bacterium]